MSFLQGDILLVPFVFSDGRTTKRRPVMVLYDAGDDDLLVVPVTSHLPRPPHDVELDDWQQAGLRLASSRASGKASHDR